MRRLEAAEGATWGIAGPTFVMLYAGLAVMALVCVLVWRRRYRVGPQGASRPAFTPTQLAVLNGGGQLAVYTSLAALRAAGAVRVVDGRLEQAGAIFPDAPALDRALYTAAGTRLPPGPEMIADPRVSAVLDRVEAELAEQGWLLTRSQCRYVRRGAVPMLAVFALGLARVVAGISNHRPVGYLVGLMLLVAVAAGLLLVVPRQTRAARSLLDRVRRSMPHLQPTHKPSWVTYGPAGAALSVALFGGAAIWAADPAFAAAAAIRHPSADDTVAAASSCGGAGGGDGGCGGGGGGCGG